ncbi:protein kinase domain-containing protein [Kribbella sp. NPDC055110]
MLVAKRYRLGSSIGRGGMGEVFRATDEQLGRVVAVKLMLPSGRDVDAAERFQREARAAARLSDPHVVSVYDFGHHDDGFFLVMELVEGRTVAAELAQSGPLPSDRAIDIVEQAAAGLAVAHREGVVHRDVKPGNLLLAPDGTVKVADFGIAHIAGDGTTLTATGQIVGSSHYLAPERAKGASAGEAADVYSLGCVLYQLVTGQPPFTAEHPAAILYQHVDAAPTLPSLARPELGGQFESVLLGMLAKDAAGRPSAAEIAAGALRGQPRPELGGVKTARSAAVEAPLPSRMRSKSVLVGVLAALAATAAVLVVVVLNGNSTRLPPTTDVGPRPGSGPSTPTSQATTPTVGRSPTGKPKQATSVQPSRSASSPATRSPSPSTRPTGTTSSSAPAETSATSSAPTRPTPTAPSTSAPAGTPTTSTSTAHTPSPSPQTIGTPTGIE